MKMMRLLILSLCLIVGLSTCKKEKCPCQDLSNPECENYDPCYGKIITGDFFIHQYDSWYKDPKSEKPENCDTVILNGAKFNALMPGANSYNWRVGTDIRIFSNRTLELLFGDYKSDFNNLNPLNKNYYKPIPITLTVRNRIGGCIQAKDSVLTKTRNLVFARESPWPGTYRGISNHDGKERVIKLYRYVIPNDMSGGRTVFKNLPNILNKDSIIMRMIPSNKLRTFKTTWWDFERDDVQIDWSSSEIPKTRPFDGMNMGKIHINPQQDGKDLLIFEYKYCTEDGRVKFYKFTGRREY